MDPEEKQKFADTERMRYLEKLREQSARRQTEKELEQLALAARAEHALKTAEEYLQRIARQSEYRAHVKKHWHAGHKLHEETLQKIGQFHRDRLAWFVSRTLGEPAHHGEAHPSGATGAVHAIPAKHADAAPPAQRLDVPPTSIDRSLKQADPPQLQQPVRNTEPAPAPQPPAVEQPQHQKNIDDGKGNDSAS